MKSQSLVTAKDLNGVVPGLKGKRAFPIPGFRNLDPFLMLDQVGPDHKPGYQFESEEMHPHRGFATLTMMLEGTMKHKDSMGSRLDLPSQSIQMMHAGSGIQHGGSMYSDSQTGIFHEIQLWINAPAAQKMTQPWVKNFKPEQIPEKVMDGVKFKVFAGEWMGLKGPAEYFTPLQIMHVKSEESAKIQISEITPYETAYLYVLKGAVTIDGKLVNEFQTVDLHRVSESGDYDLRDGTEFLILGGQPIGEPVVYGGPFVMNSEEEIQQAHSDFRKGRF